MSGFLNYSKLVNETYPKKKDLYNLIHYVVGEHCTSGYVGATGMNLASANLMYQSMLSLKKDYHKNSGRQALHAIVSFNSQELPWITPQLALQIGYQLALGVDGLQCVFAVHDNTEHLHIHFVMNSVNYLTGLKIGFSVSQFHHLFNVRLQHILQTLSTTYNPNAVNLSIDDLDNL